MEHPITPPTSGSPEKRRKPYQKPTLVVHGTVGELTQSGGRRRRDGFRTNLLS
jgi:hypothetical protein